LSTQDKDFIIYHISLEVESLTASQYYGIPAVPFHLIPWHRLSLFHFFAPPAAVSHHPFVSATAEIPPQAIDLTRITKESDMLEVSLLDLLFPFLDPDLFMKIHTTKALEQTPGRYLGGLQG